MSSSVYAYIVTISDAFYSLLKTQFVTVSLQSGKLFSIFFFFLNEDLLARNSLSFLLSRNVLLLLILLKDLFIGYNIIC